MDADWNWLQHPHPHAADPAAATPVFAGHKLVVVGGSSGMGRQTPPTWSPPAAAR